MSTSVLGTSADDPLVTIAIPTFNRASWLRDCVVAALAQSYKNFEIVVSDNASTDETGEMLREFHDPRLRVVRQERNIGLIPNWNACLAEAKGDYIVFVSDDDRVAPWLLERCIALLRLDPQIPIVIALSDVHFVAEAQTWRAPPSPTLRAGICDGADILHEFLKDRISATMCSIVFRTNRLRARGGLSVDLPYAGDMASWAPLLLEGKAGFINESCASFAIHSGSQTSKSAVNIRINDGHKVVELIANTTARSISDPQKRIAIMLDAQRYFARRVVALLASHRREGAKFRDVAPLIWEYRRDFTHIGIRNMLKLARPLAILFLPEPITRCIRSLTRVSLLRGRAPRI